MVVISLFLFPFPPCVLEHRCKQAAAVLGVLPVSLEPVDAVPQRLLDLYRHSADPGVAHLNVAECEAAPELEAEAQPCALQRNNSQRVVVFQFGLRHADSTSAPQTAHG